MLSKLLKKENPISFLFLNPVSLYEHYYEKQKNLELVKNLC